MNILYILVAILLLGILVTVHEFGHFLSARLLGISVQEFAVGWGPKLFSRVSKKSGIRYSVRVLPMGGFCSFYSADPEKGITRDDPRCFSNARVWKRLITFLMGPMMNLILAFVVLTGFYLATGTISYDPCFASVDEGSPAYTAGIQDEDLILAVNGTVPESIQQVSDAISAWQEGDAPVSVEVQHADGTVETLAVSPQYDAEAERYRIGVTIGYKSRTKALSDGTLVYDYSPVSFLQALQYSWSGCVYAGGLILSTLKDLVTTGKGIENTTGIVGTVAIISQQVETGGWDSFVNLLIVISINLGIMNLLPFPGLDGSHIVFGILEAIRRKPIPEDKENLVHLIGLGILFALMIVLIFKDTISLMK